MIRIAITPAAYAAIAGMLPGDVGVERARAENGDIYIWLDSAVVAKLKALHGPGESYSDVFFPRSGKKLLGRQSPGAATSGPNRKAARKPPPPQLA
jgi:hypothetical protein